MLNKRKALIGWLVYTIGKPVAKRTMKSKAKAAVPGKRGGAIAAGVAGLGAAIGGLMFWRRRRSEQEETPQT